MAIIKCKMCGGELVLAEDSATGKCEYCGTVQTVPQADDEKKLIQFERAERLRKQCEFDKAAGLYESIVADFRQEAEAYWGLVLCKYGIEYVDDPATGKKIPTCHRSSFQSILDDSDFEQTLENADVTARRIYREEAKVIEQLRKDIVAISNNEAPYDIFICYKETDDKGQRTLDSVLAQDIYGALTREGYRVFFSRISLEDKLGQEYEPYIFAALTSAKVMLAVGTDYEHFNAVWVKNEWGRFLKLMAKDHEKHLIPCYKGIDAYDLPREFNKLQAQDLGKVGALQDLLRGIEKLLSKVPQKETPVSVQPTGGPGVSSLLERVFLFLEDAKWQEADAYCEKVLDIDPKNALAYLGKLLAERKIRTRKLLGELSLPFDNSDNYHKALRFGDEALKQELIQANEQAKTRQENNRLEKNRIAEQKVKRKKKHLIISATAICLVAVFLLLLFTSIIPSVQYNKAEELAEQGKTAEAAIAFAKMDEFKDSTARSKELWDQVAVPDTISAGTNHTVGLKADGTVVATGNNNHGRCNVNDWNDIVAISAKYNHTVGLKSNGTVVAVGANEYGRCNVSEWSNIVAISAGWHHTVGLSNNGTVVAVGENNNGQCDVSDWTDIVAISAGHSHTVGLKADGTVVAAGENRFDQCNVSGWTDIVAICAGESHTVGLKADGTVVAVGYDSFGQCGVSKWTNIVSISAGSSHTVGLKADGTVVAVGSNNNRKTYVSPWTDIVAISAGAYHTVGLRADGTVVAVGEDNKGQCYVSKWTDLKKP